MSVAKRRSRHVDKLFAPNDSQLGNGGRDPIGWRIRSRHALPGVWILDVPQAIPYEASDV